MSVGLAVSDQLVVVYICTYVHTYPLISIQKNCFRETVQLMENFQDSTALVLVLIHM